MEQKTEDLIVARGGRILGYFFTVAFIIGFLYFFTVGLRVLF
jgi:hypothetical protein